MGGSAANGGLGGATGESQAEGKRPRARGKGRAQTGKARARGEAIAPNTPLCFTVVQGGVSNVLPYRPPFSCFHILRDIPPRRRVLDVQDGIGFRPLRAKDFCGGGYGAQILRQDREERGLGIGDERKRSILGGIFGIRAGRACGRAAERPEDRIARPPFRTAHGFAARLRRSTSRPQYSAGKNQF